MCSVRFNDEGSLLAACSWDQKLYLLEVKYRPFPPAKMNRSGRFSYGGQPVGGQQGTGDPEVALVHVLVGNSSSPTTVMFSKGKGKELTQIVILSSDLSALRT